MKLVGLVVVRNFLELDYSPIQAANSLIPHCEKVVVVDMESDDGSFEYLREYGYSDSRLEIVSQPWDFPHNDPQWWVKALNRARETFIDSRDFLLQLDADEVLGPESKEGIQEAKRTKKAALFKRLNFWQDPQHLAPHNRVCGTMVARMGPANRYLPSDEPHPAVSPNIRDIAQEFHGLTIYHYGFLRKPESFVRKSEVVQNAFFGSVDPRLKQTQAEKKRWDQYDYFDGEPLQDFRGQHPAEIRTWLIDRGYQL